MKHIVLRRHISVVVALGVCVAAVVSSFAARERPRVTVKPQKRPESRVPPYPRGRWRLLPFQDLDRVVVWTSHIVIAHRDSHPEYMGLGSKAYGSPPQRSRAEARELALRVAGMLQGKTGNFAHFAAEYSDDIITKTRGGSLGGMKATQLPGEFLDALAFLAPGQVSKVFETQFGFHILLRHAPPPEQQVGMQRIVVAYRDVLRLPGQHPVERSRTEALERAETIVAAARQQNASFEELVRRYSDGADGKTGDLGVFSTRDPAYSGAEIEQVSALDVGAVADPIDSKLGFEVLKRTPGNAREAFAMSAIRFRFDLSKAPNDPESKEATHRVAKSVARRLAANGSLFETFQKQYCCATEVVQWTKGRGPPGLDEAMVRFKVGQTGWEPIESDVYWVIPRRLDAAAQKAPPTPIYDQIPAPTAPDYEAIIRNSSGDALARYVRLLGPQAEQALRLSEQQRVHFAQLLSRLAESFQNDDADERMSAAALVQGELKVALGPEKFTQWESFLNDRATGDIMSGATR
ncbi:MAG TPA: peptidylprolyl isomerase [Polyangiaceae bacterium]|nr:peptidylprolyl isomerase [Polyangiaceae bacterium]